MELNKKVNIAIYKGSEIWSSEFVGLIDLFEPNNEYTRQSNIIEVGFSERPESEVILEEVNNIDRNIEELKSKTVEKIHELAERKEELLALTYEL